MPAAKQVIYVDVDDEITAIIDKMNSADARVVALVLPKRASVFQSVVNMKLLKRRAEQAGKNLVLITSEASLMPLAGLAAVYVAPTLQSKPEIPAGPDQSGLPSDLDDDQPVSLADDFNAKNAATPVGALAASNAPGVNDLPDDVQELDKASATAKAAGKPSPQLAAMAAGGAAASKAGSKDKKLAVPNFFHFRKQLIFAGLAVVLLAVLWYVAAFVLPTATITVRTQTSDIDSNLSLTLDSEAKTLDPETMVVPAKVQQQQKNNTQQVPATGQENRGEKASGQVRLSLTDCSQDSVTVPAGTGLSANGMTFITQSGATLSSVEIGGSCRNSDFANISSATVAVAAQKGGAGYNLAPTSFSGGPAGVSAASSAAFTGGTDKIIKIVQQSDIDAAKAKLTSASEKETMEQELSAALTGAGLYPLKATFNTATGNLVTSAKVGDEAEAVTVSETMTHTMFGVKKADVRKVIEADIADKIDKTRQSILDDGIDKARVSVGTPGGGPQLKVDMRLIAVAGPQLDVEQLKAEAVGKKSGVVKDAIKANPGVEDVTVTYKPFWVTKAPKASKITVTFEKSATSSDSNTPNDQDAASESTETGDSTTDGQ